MSGGLQEPKLCTKPSCSQGLTLCPALMDTPRLQDWMCDTGSPHTAQDIRPCSPWQGCKPRSHSLRGGQGCPALSGKCRICPAPSQENAGLSSSLPWKCRIFPAPSQGIARLSSSLLAPLEMPLMTYCCSHHLDDYMCQHLQTKALLTSSPGTSWGQKGALSSITQVLGSCHPSPQPRAPAPALSEEARTAGSQIFVV